MPENTPPVPLHVHRDDVHPSVAIGIERKEQRRRVVRPSGSAEMPVPGRVSREMRPDRTFAAARSSIAPSPSKSAAARALSPAPPARQTCAVSTGDLRVQ